MKPSFASRDPNTKLLGVIANGSACGFRYGSQKIGACGCDMPQPRKVSDEGMAEIVAVAKVRYSLPSDKDLALRCRISESRLQQIMRSVRTNIHNSVGSTKSKLTLEELEALAVEIMRENDYRLHECDEVPMKRRPFQRRPAPRTALISERAKELIEERQNSIQEVKP